MKSNARRKQKDSEDTGIAGPIHQDLGRGGKQPAPGFVRFALPNGRENGTVAQGLPLGKTVISVTPQASVWEFWHWQPDDIINLPWKSHVRNMCKLFGDSKVRIIREEDMVLDPEELINVMHGRINEKYDYLEYSHFYGFIMLYAASEVSSVCVKDWAMAKKPVEKRTLEAFFWLVWQTRGDNDNMLVDNLEEALTDTRTFNRNEYCMRRFQNGSDRLPKTSIERTCEKLYQILDRAKGVSTFMDIQKDKSEFGRKVYEALCAYQKNPSDICVMSDEGSGWDLVDSFTISYDWHDSYHWNMPSIVIPLESHPDGKQHKLREKFTEKYLLMMDKYVEQYRTHTSDIGI